MIEADYDRVIHADCHDALSVLPDAFAQLIYLDPPFNTGVKRGYVDAFGSSENYIAYMRPRVRHMQRLLNPTGSLFFHCDWRASHHVKVLLDQIFEVGRRDGGVFVNEIIWHYGLGAARPGRTLLSKHDVIFWYARSKAYTFNLLRSEPTEAMLRKYCHLEDDGRRYMMSYGKRYYMKGGKPLDDVWNLPAIAPTSGERTGYPTQKPLALLERVIALASNPGDVVLDPFCGSGTTIAAAQRLGRHWYGIDQREEAVAVARGRVAA